eukprot:66992-Amphidinium_carterae.1
MEPRRCGLKVRCATTRGGVLLRNGSLGRGTIVVQTMRHMREVADALKVLADALGTAPQNIALVRHASLGPT